MAARLIPPCQVAPLAKHTATVIFLHGLGDSGLGWRAFAELLKYELPHVKWVLPNAPNLRITANMGLSMPGWFDLYSFGLEEKREDRERILASARTIDGHIQDEINAGIPPERIVVGGFSQGGCMSLLTGLTARGREGQFGGQDGWKLGGVVALSCWLLLHDEFPKIVSPHLTKMPVLMCHGTDDPIVPYKLGEQSSEALAKHGLPTLEQGKLGTAGLSFKRYESLDHSSSPEEIQDIKQFLMHVLPRD
ncbi:Phospholipase/carboxylesterase/thioesterase [Tylopilus felleus]